jgi:hypothetical protein
MIDRTLVAGFVMFMLAVEAGVLAAMAFVTCPLWLPAVIGGAR